MNFEITEQERNLILELIASAEDEAIRGLDHAYSRDFKAILRDRLEVLASVKEKLQSSGSQAA